MHLVDDRCGAAVLRPGTFVRAGGCRTFLAVGDNTDTGRVDALRQQEVARGGTAALAKGEVVLSRAALVTMAFKGHRKRRIGVQERGLAHQGAFGVGAQSRAVIIEKDGIADRCESVFSGRLVGDARRGAAARGTAGAA